MEITVKRRLFAETYTIGTMFINGERFCDTLENKVRTMKIPKETAIPAGTYRVTLERSPKFGRVLPYLHNVPDFEGVLIHRGNTAADTSGCILVGENKVKGAVINSTPYEIELVKRISEANETINLSII